MEQIFLSRVIGFFIILVSGCASDIEDICDRRPLGTKSEPLPPDNQFFLDIDDIKDNKYIPGWTYKVRLRSRDEKSTFIAFTISLKEDTAYNADNPRRPKLLKAGTLEPNSTNAKSSPVCKNTIVESDVTAKTSVEALWTAPGKDNKCVSIFAVVAVEPNVWYSFERPLSKRVCEDPRKSEDMQPLEIDGDCQVCEDARYQLKFEGLWAYNTHSDMFPPTKDLARFSDVVGASHSPNTAVFKYSSDASPGLKMLAEQGNTTQFEIEIQRELPKLVRTVIKATRPELTTMSTVTSFRATPEHHRLSIAAGIMPSPDWFLGVSNLELCDEKSNWAENIRLNLYPIDAGTDKGLDFESSNEEQSPPQPISLLAKIGKEQKEVTKPFARLILTRVRTYTTPECTTVPPVTEESGGNDEGESEEQGGDGGYEDRNNYEESKPSYVTTRTTTSEEPPVVVDPDSSEKCPMTNWDEWEPCEGVCVNNTLSGLQIRFRYHIVDGTVIKYSDSGSPVSQYCLDNNSVMDTQPCEDTCNENGEAEEGEEEENDAEASRRTWQNNWGRK